MTDCKILNKSNADSCNKEETAHQQDTEEHVMMAWEALDNSTRDRCRGRKLTANEIEFEDTKNVGNNFFYGLNKTFHEIMLGGQIYQKMMQECNMTAKMKILMIPHPLIVHV